MVNVCMKRLIKSFFLFIAALSFPSALCAGGMEPVNYEAFFAVHKNFEKVLNGEAKERYLASHAAFMEYFAAEKENLAIFKEALITRKKEKLYIYRETLDTILKNRAAELESLRKKDGAWLSQKTRSDLARAFAAVNQRVPYDRGEKLRPTFRRVDRAWKEYVGAERAFYSLYLKNDQKAPENCERVLRELRTRDLLLEHKGVAAIKIEKEE